MDRLRTDPEFAGFLFFEELARKIIGEQPELWQDRTAFHLEVYRRQCEREDRVAGRPFVTDRGTIDAFAFHPETIVKVGTSIEAEYARYSGVIQLGSAAVLGEPHYRCDEIRKESPADALAIEDAVRKVWSKHPQYRYIPADIDLEEKYGAFYRQIVDYKQA